MERRKFGIARLLAARVVAGALALALSVPASAGSFRIDPVQIELPPDHQAASLKMFNSGSKPVSIKVESLQWTQSGGQDRYASTNNVIASPPIFTIPPGQTQLVRVGLRSRSQAGAYRVIFEEIPTANPEPGEIQVALRLNLPLYVEPAAKEPKPSLNWRAWKNQAGDLLLEATNNGSTHVQVVQLSTERQGRDELLSKQMGVVLPGSSRVWTIGPSPDLRTGTSFLLKVREPTGATETQVTPAQL